MKKVRQKYLIAMLASGSAIPSRMAEKAKAPIAQKGHGNVEDGDKVAHKTVHTSDTAIHTSGLQFCVPLRAYLSHIMFTNFEMEAPRMSPFLNGSRVKKRIVMYRSVNLNQLVQGTKRKPDIDET